MTQPSVDPGPLDPEAAPSAGATTFPASAHPSPGVPVAIGEELLLKDRVAFHVDLWKKTVDVQQHFNDIEWRIRGLALTAATFALGAAGVAANDGTQVGPLSLGSVIIVLGLILWYAFYFVDRVWYHPMLKAAVDQGARWEREFQQHLPLAGAIGAPGMTDAISAGSANAELGWLTSFLSRKKHMHSSEKLVWFYGAGALALVLAAIALQIGVVLSPPASSPQPIIVRLETPAPSAPSTHQTPQAAPSPSSSPPP